MDGAYDGALQGIAMAKKAGVEFQINTTITQSNLDQITEIQKLASLVKKNNLFLVADEVYREFTYDGKEHYSILRENGLKENAIVIDSVS